MNKERSKFKTPPEDFSSYKSDSSLRNSIFYASNDNFVFVSMEKGETLL